MQSLLWIKSSYIFLHMLTCTCIFLEGVSGGVSHILKRYSKENNKDLTSYDSKTPTKYFPYLDKNNLYIVTLC